MWVIYEYWFARMKNISDNKKKKLREAYGSAKEIYYIEETQLRLQNFLTKKDIEQLKMARKQKDLEEKAFALGGSNYYAPIQRVEDFLQDKKSTFIGKIEPTYLPGVTLSNLNDILPEFVCSTLKEGILYFNNKLEGFANPDSILTGVETRSSSPVKIVRNESLVSNIIGLYPCGEGARLCWRYYVCSSRWN